MIFAIVIIIDNYHTGLVGLAISYALSITNLLSGVVSSFTETEKQLVSVERVNQYIEKITPEWDGPAVEESYAVSLTAHRSYIVVFKMIIST